MTYSPKTFYGEYAQGIFAEVLYNDKTTNAPLVRVLDNVKYQTTVTSASGDVPLVAYNDYITESALATVVGGNSLAFGDEDVNPVRVMAVETFAVAQILGSRFTQSMRAGANNVDSTEMETEVAKYLTPRIARSFRQMFWSGITAASKTAIAAGAATTTQKAWAAAQTAGPVDGIIAQAILKTGSVLGVVGTTITSSNIVAEYDKILAAMPAQVLSHRDTKLFVPSGDRALILSANSSATYRDKFQVEGLKTDNEKVSYQGLDIEFVDLSGVPRIAGHAGPDGDFVLATDLLSDMAEVTFAPINALSDRKFMKMVMALDTALLVPTQKVLYL